MPHELLADTVASIIACGRDREVNGGTRSCLLTRRNGVAA